MINVLVMLIGLIGASITDLKTGYVPNILSHALILAGVVFVFFEFPLDLALSIYGVAIAVFAAGYILYISGQMGGGDVKLFTALTLLIPIYPSSLVSIMNSIGIQPAIPSYPFIISVFILFGILFMIVIPLQYIPKVYKARDKIEFYDKKIRISIAFSLLLVPVFALWFVYFKALIILTLPMLLTLFIIPFKDDIMKHFFAQKKDVQKLDDDDVIALELINDKVKKKLGLWRKTPTKKELEKIKKLAKKYHIKQITVCENMPKAVPIILAAFILSLIFGDVLLFLLMNTY